MDIKLIHPELQKATASFPRVSVTSNFGRKLTRLLLPILLPRPKIPSGITIETLKIPQGPKLRIYSPEGDGPFAAMLYIHGGGMMIGTPAMDDALLANTALQLKIVIISPEYRLAPEHPFPAGLDDCHRSWHWLLENASARNIDSSRLAVGGESAGGGLAAGLGLRLHDEAGIQPVAQWLFCPMLDDRTSLDRSLDEIDHFVWNNKMNLAGWSSYLGDSLGQDNVSAYAAPSRRKDLTGLPKTWIGVGDVELFFEEDRKYAEALAEAGVECQLDVVAGAPHAFEGLVPDAKLSKDYLARAKDWLAQSLHS
jgi:acetyl esterase/lipase